MAGEGKKCVMRLKRILILGVVVLALVTIAAVGQAKTDSYNFSVNSSFGDRDVFTFEVTTVGTIRVEAHWSSLVAAPPPLALILNGPGQVGYYQRVDGPSPLVVTQQVTPDILSRGTQWTASIVNFSRSGQASGTLRIDYPVLTPVVTHYNVFDTIVISDVEKYPNRAVITANYTLNTTHARPTFMGAKVLANREELKWFGYVPAAVHAGSGQVQVEVRYVAGNPPPSTWSQQISVFMYEGGGYPFCTLIDDLRLQWFRQ